MRRNLIVLFVISLIFLFKAQAQPIYTQIGNYSVPQNDTLIVKISVDNFYDVAAISLSLGYNDTILDFIGYQNLHPTMQGGIIFMGTSNGMLKISWFTFGAVGFGSDTMMQLLFAANQPGAGLLSWDTVTVGNCEYSTFGGALIPSVYQDGSVIVKEPPAGFRARLMLQACYNTSTGLMNTVVSGASGFPVSHPFSGSPWNYPGTESIDSIAPDLVDWVLVEVRDTADAATVIERRAGLLLSNGSVVDTNYSDPLILQSAGNYYFAVKHANHLPVMTAHPVIIPDTVVYDFTDTLNFPSYSTQKKSVIALGDGNFGMIAGDVNRDGTLKYSGPANDRSLVLQKIITVSGSTSISTTINGYYGEDVNLNGQVKYSGPGNDPSRIIQNLVLLNGTSSITGTYATPIPAAIIP